MPSPRVIRVLSLALLAVASLWAGACSDRSRPSVTLYTSCDAPVAAEVVAVFEQETGIDVRLVTDTEATKTTGLIQRLLAERDRPAADVWWSNELLGTAQLASLGLLSPSPAPDFGGMWPEHLRGPDGLWYGHALRTRVIAYRLRPGLDVDNDVPATLAAMALPRFKGRIGMARPQFGTTRMHLAALVAMHGERVVEAWLTALRDNDLRLYDGNAAVVQALAKAEIDVGLTDSDDALVAKDRNWPVAYRLEDPQGQAPQGVPALPAGGAIVIPNTVAIVAGTQRRALAEQLAAFLLSARCERLLAESDAKTISIRDGTPLPSPATLDPAALIEATPRADALLRKVLGPG